MLNEYMRKSGLKGCVVSVSGGVDSAVIMALVEKAKRKENSPIQRVFILPWSIIFTIFF